MFSIEIGNTPIRQLVQLVEKKTQKKQSIVSPWLCTLINVGRLLVVVTVTVGWLLCLQSTQNLRASSVTLLSVILFQSRIVSLIHVFSAGNCSLAASSGHSHIQEILELDLGALTWGAGSDLSEQEASLDASSIAKEAVLGLRFRGARLNTAFLDGGRPAWAGDDLASLTNMVP